MATVLIFHHALGLTDGLSEFAATVRSSGHTVIAPDLFDGRTFDSVEAGVAYATSIGFDEISDRGIDAAEPVDDDVVTVGFSLGVLPAQRLAQTRPAMLGTVLCHAAIPRSAFGEAWPSEVALQVHIGDNDPWAEEDLPAARDLVSEARGELFLYEGHGHLIAEPGSPDYDPRQANLLVNRILAFIGNV